MRRVTGEGECLSKTFEGTPKVATTALDPDGVLEPVVWVSGSECFKGQGVIPRSGENMQARSDSSFIMFMYE